MICIHQPICSYMFKLEFDGFCSVALMTKKEFVLLRWKAVKQWHRGANMGLQALVQVDMT